MPFTEGDPWPPLSHGQPVRPGLAACHRMFELLAPQKEPLKHVLWVSGNICGERGEQQSQDGGLCLQEAAAKLPGDSWRLLTTHWFITPSS